MEIIQPYIMIADCQSKELLIPLQLETRLGHKQEAMVPPLRVVAVYDWYEREPDGKCTYVFKGVRVSGGEYG